MAIFRTSIGPSLKPSGKSRIKGIHCHRYPIGLRTMKDNALIFDIGLHHGQDTAYYLHLGYRVVGVDADPNLISQAKTTFATSIAQDKLQLTWAAIAAEQGQEVDFVISESDEWNSVSRELAERRGPAKAVVRVSTRTLASLIDEFGVPHYCKIDIEGHDLIALQSMRGSHSLPEFISVETECTGQRKLSEEEALQTLDELKALGYTRFKLVDQRTLAVLRPEVKFYTVSGLLEKVLIRAVKLVHPRAERAQRRKAIRAAQYYFAPTASGTFGESLAGQWSDFETSKRLLLRHRNDYFKLPDSANWGFWCDWHAKIG
jgi:FkbM family methyltransferase